MCLVYMNGWVGGILCFFLSWLTTCHPPRVVAISILGLVAPFDFWGANFVDLLLLCCEIMPYTYGPLIFVIFVKKLFNSFFCC